jgi:hypothetical protein
VLLLLMKVINFSLARLSLSLYLTLAAGRAGGKTYAQGSLLAVPVSEYLAGDVSHLVCLFEPTSRTSLESQTPTHA